jgi:hypothetical protein
VAINIVGGSISDVWYGDKARSVPMSLFGLTSVIGIALGPFVGSAIQAIHKNDPWRWYATCLHPYIHVPLNSNSKHPNLSTNQHQHHHPFQTSPHKLKLRTGSSTSKSSTTQA